MRLLTGLLVTAAALASTSARQPRFATTTVAPPLCTVPCRCEVINKLTARLRAFCTVRGPHVPDGMHVDSTVDDVDFSGSVITVVSPLLLERVRGAKVLQLQAVGARWVQEKAFEPLTGLWSLDLSLNHLHSLPMFSFSTNAQLRRLSLRGNPLLPDARAPLLVAPQLEWLDLTGCGLRSLTAAWFANLTALRTLMLRDNLLSVLPTSALAPLSQLRALRLQENRLLFFPSAAIQALPMLTELLLDENSLMEGPLGPVQAPRLQRLSAMGCALESVAPRLLSGLPELRYLMLTANRLTELWLFDEQKRKPLVLLAARYNPLACDCVLRDTWHWATEQGGVDEAEVQCGDPPIDWADAGLQGLQCDQPPGGEESGKEEPGGGLVALWTTLALLAVLAAGAGLVFAFRRQLASRFFSPQRRVVGADAVPLEENYEEQHSEDGQDGRAPWLD